MWDTLKKTLKPKQNMFSSHFSFAIRFFRKEGAYTLLNLLGLILGIGIGIILLLYLQNELSYDTHHSKGDRVYRVSQYMKTKSGEYNTARTPRELGPLLKKEIPEVLNYVRFNLFDKTMITVHNKSGKEAKFYEERVMETDSSLLSLFTHEVFEGNPKNCLSGPGKVVLTLSIAKKYYGDKPALGRVITLPTGEKRTVSAVISDLPDNSHLKYDLLLSEISERKRFANTEDLIRKSEAFWNPRCYTYVLMPEEYRADDWNDRFQVIFENHYTSFGKKIEGSATSALTVLSDIHYTSDLQDDEVQGDLSYLYTFATIGLLVILLVSVNYMNMATARSIVRTKEIGIRKVLGSTRRQLFFSVLSEALIMSLLAMFFAIIIVFIVLEATPFNSWINKDLNLNFLSNPQLLFGVLIISLSVGLISGLYPAAYIPSVKVTSALKGSVQTNRIETYLRKSLIVLQFSVSIFVVLLVVMMNQQTSYLKSTDIGFNKDNLLVIPLQGSMTGKVDAIRNKLYSNPNILSITSARTTPGINVHSPAFRVEQDGEMVIKSLGVIITGSDYLKTMEMEIVEGRDFRPEDSRRESPGVIINQTAAEELGWARNPLNKRVRFFNGKVDMHVIGVVKDFNFQSLHNSIGPLVILRSGRESGALHVRVLQKGLDQTLAFLKEQFEVFDPAHPFEYSFVNQEFEKQYQAEQIQMQLISLLSVICIIVSALGLIGLSAFNIDQKAKEISIRKVIGASTESILVKFSKEYVFLILVAIVLAIPSADYMINEWLAAFAYQVNIKWYIYLIPGFLVLLLGLIIVLLQSIKSAQANPVRSLRQS